MKSFKTSSLGCLSTLFESDSRSARFHFSILTVGFWFFSDVFNLFTSLLESANRKYIWSQLLAHLPAPELFIFTISFFAPYALIAAAIFLTMELARPQNRIFFFVAFQSYVFLFLTLRNPQLMEDFVFFRSSIGLLMPLLSPPLVAAAGTMVLISLFPWGHKVSIHRGAAFIAVAGWAIFMGFVNNPLFEINTPSLSGPDSAGHIVLIGIDGMDRDIFQRLAVSGKYPFTENFLKRSKTFSHSYTEIARTSPTLTSILSGIPPHESRLRSTMEDLRPALADARESSHIQSWLKQGGHLEYRFSDSDFVDFGSSSLFAKKTAPASQIFSLTAPFLIRSRILFGFFNNSLGAMLFPQVILNSSFQNTYDVRFFQKQVLQDISEFSGPTLYFSHLTKLHWPGSFEYPYYLFRENDDDASSRFSYSSMLHPFRLSGIKKEYNVFNFGLYVRGHELILDQYIEPLLRSFTEKKLFEKSTVVIYSDHNESFNSKSVPLPALPTHGVWMPPDDTSNETTLIVSTPDGIHGVDDTRFPLHSLLPALIDKSRRPISKTQIFETDWWYGAVFRNELRGLKPGREKLEYDGDKVFLPEKTAQVFFLSKVRTLEMEKNYFSLLPSTKGYLWIQSSQNSRNAPSMAKAWEEFQRVYKADFESGKLPKFDSLNKIDNFTMVLGLAENEKKGALGKLLQATFDLNNYQHLQAAISVLSESAQDTKLDPHLRSSALFELSVLCSRSWKAILESFGLRPPHPSVSLFDEDPDGVADINRIISCLGKDPSIQPELVRFVHENHLLLSLQSRQAHHLEFLTFPEDLHREKQKTEALDWPFWIPGSALADSNLNVNFYLDAPTLKSRIGDGLCRKENDEYSYDCE